jgi:glucose-6-phosphate 1-dehydrogenase
MGTLAMSFSYKDIFGVEMPEAYQRLLLDCMSGDQTLFTRFDSVATAWQFLTPVLQAWEHGASTPTEYPAGSDSFPQADMLLETEGRKWHGLLQL